MPDDDWCGPTRVSTLKSCATTTRVPQIWQNLKFAGTTVPHFVHGVPVGCGCGATAVALPFGPDGLLVRRGRGSRATGCPQRAHWGTPIGVNALHASHTKPTSIACDSTLLRNGASKNAGLSL